MLELGEDAPARAESTCDHQDFAPKGATGNSGWRGYTDFAPTELSGRRVKPEPSTSTLRPKLDSKTKPGPR
jgi:hypothetical protein